MDGIADYRFVRPLGKGSHGLLFVAVPPPRLGLDVEHVAVKVLAGGTDEDAFRRTTRELRAFATAQSPYLITLFDAGQQDRSFFYSMEYFRRGSLADPSTSLSRVEVLTAMAHAVRAAHALHEAGIVHRSIKPGNVLLADDGGGRLSDLGLAEALTPGQTVTGLGPIGSVEYVEPAILLGKRGSRASDVWSIGVTLHRALSGQGLYGELPDHDALFAVRKVLSGKPTISDQLKPEDRALVEHCLQPEPADRPADALRVAERLEALAAQG